MNKPKETLSIKEEEFLNFSERYRARFINSLSGVKSANLIGTCDKNGKTNLSILSSVFHLGSSPALIGLIIRPDTARRDTLNNIRETGFYTINHVNREILEQAHQTSARYPQEISEFDACNLTPEYLNNFCAPHVLESHIKMSVEKVREINIEENGTHLIIGKITNVYLPNNCFDTDGRVDILRAGTVSVSGLDSY
ncbi:MAG: flavin reductase, partial [Bacteriovoracaceae bacterium]|nr:flavin reductase [Bacteriovoracaceae bacterium]